MPQHADIFECDRENRVEIVWNCMELRYQVPIVLDIEHQGLHENHSNAAIYLYVGIHYTSQRRNSSELSLLVQLTIYPQNAMETREKMWSTPKKQKLRVLPGVAEG